VEEVQPRIDLVVAADLYDDHVDAVYGYLARRLGASVAVDLTADVFEIAIAKIGDYDPDLGSQRAWLFGIATNMIRRHWRTERRRLTAWHRMAGRTPVVSDPLVDVADQLDATSEVSAVMSAIAEIPAADRDLLFLIAWEELSYSECAQILDIPVGTVRSRLHRIRRQIKQAALVAPRNQEE